MERERIRVVPKCVSSHIEQVLWRQILGSVCIDRAVFYDRKWTVRGLLAVRYTPAGVINGIVIVCNSDTSVHSCSAGSL